MRTHLDQLTTMFWRQRSSDHEMVDHGTGDHETVDRDQ
jgi:hypothetical protein